MPTGLGFVLVLIILFLIFKYLLTYDSDFWAYLYLHNIEACQSFILL